MENPPVDILENLRKLFTAITGGLLTVFPFIVVALTFILLVVLGILMFLFSGTPSFQLN
ncbi:hypothetical protein IPM65_00265 [Candidatus Roizmanbacteria bacterium]|nr:MAG: hypothetical protein IPM65_00265 [Candidatus Roizmanbacteria bacterium]